MRKNYTRAILSVMIAAVIVSMLLFSGCSTKSGQQAEAAMPTAYTKEPVKSTETPEPLSTEAALTQKPDTAVYDQDEPFFRLFCKGEEVPVYETYFWVQTAVYEGDTAVGWRLDDNTGISSMLSYTLKELPVIEWQRMEYSAAKGANLTGINIFDHESYDKLYELDTMEELMDLLIDHSRSLVIEICLTRNFGYVAELGDHECAARGYAFIVK